MDARSLRTPAVTIPAAVFLLALILRILGIGWGLPDARRAYSLHPDEPINILYSQRAIEPARLSFTPDFYNYGTLYLTATRVASDVATTYGGKNPRAELIGPRVLSTLAGSILASMVAGFLARRGQIVAAWTAGLVTAVANGLVVHSRFATVDVLATALLTGGLLLAMRAAESPRPHRTLLGAAALIGLATACKYNMALGAVGLVVAALDLPKGRRAGTIGLIVVTIAVVFLLGVPGAL
ncbi:phospholipid carrier-dependent glycosyltransferase, partial [bacterium]